MYSRLLPLAAATAFFLAGPLAARAADTCGMLTTAQIASATNDPVTSTSPGPSNCIWRGKSNGIYLTIRDSSSWAKGKSMFLATGHATPVSGVGDDAFFADMGKQPWLYALKGSHFIIIHLSADKLPADQAQNALKTLANDALAHL
jgi:hypothetical protein